MSLSHRLYIWAKRLREIVSDRILLWKYRDRPYIEYYRAIMKRRTARDPKAAVGAVNSGERQLTRLVLHGLKPEHTLFDFGCGSLRGGLYLIKYLNTGNYTGNDISEEILEAGRTFLREAGLEHKQPHLYHTNDLLFSEVSGKTFDYLHAQSVLSHMPPEDIEALFSNIPKIMHPKSQFFATFFLAEGDSIYPSNQRRNFHYPFSWMQDCGAKHGLRVEMAQDAPQYIGKQKLMRITLA